MASDSCDGSIEIRNLAFAYPSRPGAPVLRDFNISIHAGKTTALVGASGSGKSTVVGLLERWYAPSSGSIMLDGTYISGLLLVIGEQTGATPNVSVAEDFFPFKAVFLVGQNPIIRFVFRDLIANIVTLTLGQNLSAW